MLACHLPLGKPTLYSDTISYYIFVDKIPFSWLMIIIVDGGFSFNSLSAKIIVWCLYWLSIHAFMMVYVLPQLHCETDHPKT
jgi:hypothetical protein